MFVPHDKVPDGGINRDEPVLRGDGTLGNRLGIPLLARVYEAVRAFTGLAGGVSEAVLLQTPPQRATNPQRPNGKLCCPP